ncbi:hypothetical protein NL676_023331 [Syzygium grande]|nr:hypothetical protein NL676_023331 [Syzygium grande]
MEGVQEESIEAKVSVSDFESKSLLLLLLGKRMGIPSGSTERQHRCERSQIPSPSPLVKQPRIFIDVVRGGLGQEPEREPTPKSRLSISNGGGGREYHHRELPLTLSDDMPSLEYDPSPPRSSYYYCDMPPLEYV